MNPPHVMMILHQLGQGGVERVALHLANGLAARGNRVSLLVLRPGGALDHRLSPQVERISPAASAGPRRGASLLRHAGEVADRIRALRPDVLLSPGNHMHSLTLLAHRRAAAPSRLALKLTNPVQRPDLGAFRNALRRAAFRMAAGSADQLLLLSEPSLLETARIAPRAAGKFRVVDNPYLPDGPRSSPPRKVVPPLLLSAGRMCPQKDPLMLVEALAGLRDLAWRLVMIGDGPLRPEVEARAAALGLEERILLPGYVADPEPWFRDAEVFVLPSRYEELPAVLFEAMAARCRIVATAASPAVEAILAGSEARMVAPGDVDGMRAALDDALRDSRQVAEHGELLRRFGIANGVASHAEALGLR